MKRSAEQIKTLIKSKLEVANIVLWGYNERAREFYNQYKDVFRITGCVTENKNHPEYLDEQGRKIEIVEWEKYKGTDEDYIIIFERPYARIENQILASGLAVFEEWVDSTILEAIMSDKKIAIMAGSCQVGIICNFLNELNSFKEQYLLFRFSTHLWTSRWSLKSLCYLRNFCDLYICMQHEEDNPMFFTREELPGRCKIVTIPSALLRLYWPPMSSTWKSTKNEYFLKWMKVKDHGPFEYGDMNINRMIREGKDVEEIIDLITSEDFYTEEQVKKHIETMMRMLDYEEDRCDIKIASYIRENWQKKMLYRDMAHMQPCLVWEMVRRILQYLGMDTREADEMEKSNDSPVCQGYNVHCTETPVYPSVAKYLGLEWYHRDMLYDVTLYKGNQKMTFEQYIRSYYSVCSKTKQCMEEW